MLDDDLGSNKYVLEHRYINSPICSAAVSHPKVVVLDAMVSRFGRYADLDRLVLPRTSSVAVKFGPLDQLLCTATTSWSGRLLIPCDRPHGTIQQVDKRTDEAIETIFTCVLPRGDGQGLDRIKLVVASC